MSCSSHLSQALWTVFGISVLGRCLCLLYSHRAILHRRSGRVVTILYMFCGTTQWLFNLSAARYEENVQNFHAVNVVRLTKLVAYIDIYCNILLLGPLAALYLQWQWFQSLPPPLHLSLTCSSYQASLTVLQVYYLAYDAASYVERIHHVHVGLSNTPVFFENHTSLTNCLMKNRWRYDTRLLQLLTACCVVFSRFDKWSSQGPADTRYIRLYNCVGCSFSDPPGGL